MRWPRDVALVSAVAFLLGFCLPTVQAAPLLREDFEQGVGEKAGDVARQKPEVRGWRAAVGGDVDEKKDWEYLEYPAAGLIAPEQGTVEFEAVRGDAAGTSLESFFSLYDAEGTDLLSVRIWWSGYSDYYDKNDHPVLEVISQGPQGPWYRMIKAGRRGPRESAGIPMGGIGKGQRFHVAFTWGKSGSDFNLFVNGRKLKAQLKQEQLEIFREAIAKATSIVVGTEIFSGRSWGQVQSVIKSFHIHDQAIDGSDLYANPEKYRSSTPLVVASVSHDASRAAGFSGKLVVGNALTVTLTGTPGAAGTFDVVHFPDLDRKIALDWRGWGVYLEEKRFFDPGEVNLRDVEGYRVYAAKEPIDIAALSAVPAEGAPPPLQPLARLEVKEQSHLLENLEIDTPYYVAVLAEMRGGTLRPVIAPIAGQPLAESAPGVYTGSCRIGYQDRYPRAVVVGRLAKDAASASFAGDASTALAIDPSLAIAVATEPEVLRADEKSTAKVTVTVTDANGAAVPGHKIKFLLATTSQYTGVVGGGAFAEQVGGAIKEAPWGETDLFGRVTATYVAGFAAKTAVIVARDMTGNSTGAGYVKTYIQSVAELELEPVVPSLMMMAEGYQITVTSSDEWLTADGKSQARITARVTLGDQPVEGHRVGFQVSAGTGQIRAVSEVTGRDGEARAVYTAGKKIGVVLITATDQTVGISGSVQIELRSDAPAKIAITLDPAKLPADGRSRADLQVLVTDINDNPNEDVEVEYAIAAGGGKLSDEKGRTDRKGESRNTYTAGRSPGRVSIEITVRSTVPTAEEIAKARDLALAVTDYRFF